MPVFKAQKRITTIQRKRAQTLRQNTTSAERKLWRGLDSLKKSGYHFRRQQVIAQFIVDFVCHRCRLIIEVDGDTHDQQAFYDADRTTILNQEGYQVMRFTNTDVVNNLEAVVAIIARRLDEYTHPTTNPLPQNDGYPSFCPPHKGEGI